MAEPRGTRITRVAFADGEATPRGTRITRVAFADGEATPRATRLVRVAFISLVPPETPPAATGPGWPVRPARADYSPGDMVDEKKTEDPTREVNAAALNLTYWNSAGLGLTLPKVLLVIDPATPVIKYGGFSWDQTSIYIGQGEPFPWFTLTVNGPGDYRLDFELSAPGPNGDPQPILFSGAVAEPVWLDGVVPGVIDRNLRGEARLTDATSIEVKIRRAFAGGEGGDLAEAPFIVGAW